MLKQLQHEDEVQGDRNSLQNIMHRFKSGKNLNRFLRIKEAF